MALMVSPTNGNNSAIADSGKATDSTRQLPLNGDERLTSPSTRQCSLPHSGDNRLEPANRQAEKARRDRSKRR